MDVKKLIKTKKVNREYLILALLIVALIIIILLPDDWEIDYKENSYLLSSNKVSASPAHTFLSSRLEVRCGDGMNIEPSISFYSDKKSVSIDEILTKRTSSIASGLRYRIEKGFVYAPIKRGRHSNNLVFRDTDGAVEKFKNNNKIVFDIDLGQHEGVKFKFDTRDFSNAYEELINECYSL